MTYKKILPLLKSRVRQNPYLFCGLALLVIWLIPLLMTGNKLELGDFSFFAQGYQAIRSSIIDYHQFPWFNPWVAGGVPLFANPQMGVFSITTIFVFIFGAPFGLKITIALFILLGYLSMYKLLHGYFKIDKTVSVLLSIIWVLCSFFVSHLPSHFTFIWYLVAPFFVYSSLTLNTKRKALLYGLLFAVMANSQVHNSFFQISVICGAILFVRLLLSKEKIPFIQLLLIALIIFIPLAAPKLLLSFQNVHEFPRQISDPFTSVPKSVLGILLPFSVRAYRHNLYPNSPWGWGEQTISIGLFAIIAVITSVFYRLFMMKGAGKRSKETKLSLFLVLLGAGFFLLGLGTFSVISPYNILKHLPLFSETRVAARWFIWLVICMLAFVGVQTRKLSAGSYQRFLIVGLLSISVLELFVLNFGYYGTVLSHIPNTAPGNIKSYTFEQTSLFGESVKLPGGKNQKIKPDNNIPKFYREYENTTYNLGTLQANDALVDLNTKPTPRCSWNKGCGLVLSKNATVASWSPNKIILHRTAPGDISLDMNDSSYFTINGKRSSATRVAEPYKPFILSGLKSNTITIQVKPGL